MTEDTQATPDSAVSAESLPVSSAPRASRAILSGFVGGLLGGAAVSLAVAAGLAVVWPQAQSYLSPQQDQTRDAELNETIATLQRRLATLETAGGAARSDDGTAVLQPHIAALAQKSDQNAADLSRMSADIESLRRAIPPEGVILRLADRAEQAEKVARQIANQHDNAQALLLVVGQLREAVNSGDSYEVELRAARKVTPQDDAAMLDALTADAATGIPRKSMLLEAFAPLANDIIHAQIAPDSDNILDRAWHKLTSLVNVRRTDGLGEDTSSIVARAEARVRDGDLTKAAQEIAKLNGAPAQAAAVWQKGAQARVNADRALSELSATAAALTAKSAN